MRGREGEDGMEGERYEIGFGSLLPRPDPCLISGCFGYVTGRQPWRLHLVKWRLCPAQTLTWLPGRVAQERFSGDVRHNMGPTIPPHCAMARCRGGWGCSKPLPLRRRRRRRWKRRRPGLRRWGAGWKEAKCVESRGESERLRMYPSH